MMVAHLSASSFGAGVRQVRRWLWRRVRRQLQGPQARAAAEILRGSEQPPLRVVDQLRTRRRRNEHPLMINNARTTGNDPYITQVQYRLTAAR